jgi:hypothetical protein
MSENDKLVLQAEWQAVLARWLDSAGRATQALFHGAQAAYYAREIDAAKQAWGRDAFSLYLKADAASLEQVSVLSSATAAKVEDLLKKKLECERKQQELQQTQQQQPSKATEEPTATANAFEKCLAARREAEERDAKARGRARARVPDGVPADARPV